MSLWHDPVKDARLDFPIETSPLDEPLAPDSSREILLTGATGFVGAFLLAELVRQTQADVHCLVRASGKAEAQQRLQANLERYHLWDPQQAGRIRAMAGDLEQPGFGLPSSDYEALAGRVEQIFHSAAQINHVLPYLLLKKANVTATQEVIRFAARHRRKWLHFLSSTAACVGQSQGRALVFPEERVHRSPTTLISAYGLSKWVAERSMENAALAGIPVTIFRGGDMSGDSLHGLGKVTDLFHLFLRLFIELGLRPEPLAGEINMLPVDFVAKAVVYLARRQQDPLCVINLVHPEPLALADFFVLLEQRGYRLIPCRLEHWVDQCQRYIKACFSTKEALVLQYLFRQESGRYLFQWYFQPYRFVTNAMTQGLAGAPFSCPPLDDRLWTGYFDHLVAIGWLPAARKT